jgi:hypothetical protein
MSGSDTITFGTNQLLNTTNWLGLPGTNTNGVLTYGYLLPRNGTLQNFYLYQAGQNYSATSGDASAVYSIQVNNGTSGFLNFDVPGSVLGDTSEVRYNNTTDTISCNQGDLLSFVITPNATDGGFTGGGYALFSCQFS